MSKAKGALVIAGMAAAVALVSGLVAAGVRNVKKQKADREENESWKLKTEEELSLVLAQIEMLSKEFGPLLSVRRNMATMLGSRYDSVQNVKVRIESSAGLSTDALQICYGFLKEQEQALRHFEEMCRASSDAPKPTGVKKKTKTKKMKG